MCLRDLTVDKNIVLNPSPRPQRTTSTYTALVLSSVKKEDRHESRSLCKSRYGSWLLFAEVTQPSHDYNHDIPDNLGIIQERQSPAETHNAAASTQRLIMANCLILDSKALNTSAVL